MRRVDQHVPLLTFLHFASSSEHHLVSLCRIAEQSTAGSRKMQSHSAFHRHTFSIPNPSRRYTNSSPRQAIKPASLSKILLSALAVTASKTVVLDTPFADGGGAGFLVLAFWAGRAANEARNEWRRRAKGKGKATDVARLSGVCGSRSDAAGPPG